MTPDDTPDIGAAMVAARRAALAAAEAARPPCVLRFYPVPGSPVTTAGIRVTCDSCGPVGLYEAGHTSDDWARLERMHRGQPDVDNSPPAPDPNDPPPKGTRYMAALVEPDGSLYLAEPGHTWRDRERWTRVGILRRPVRWSDRAWRKGA